jgi:RND superfamily putative drug exporter
MFAGLGRAVVHHPWRVIVLWVIAAAAVIGFAPKLTSTSNEASFLPSHYESIQAQDLQQSAFPQAATPAAIIVIERSDGARLTAADSAKVTAIGKTLSARHVSPVTALLVSPPSPNRLIQTIAVQMPVITNPNDKTEPNAVKALRSDLQAQLSGTGLKGGITGTAAQTLDSEKSSDRAQEIIASVTIGLIIVLLLIIFRSPIIALLPVITIGVVSQVADGFISWANEAFNLKIDSSVTALLIVVLFGVGTDYILFLLFRYRERLRAGEDSKTAMISAVTRAGEAIASAAGAVIIAFLALTLSTLGLFKSLGPKVFWPSKAWRREPTGARFAAIGAAMGRHPGRFAIASGGLMVLLAIAALGFHPNFDLTSGSTSSASESTVYSQQLLRGLPAGATEPSQVYVRSDHGAALPTGQLATYRATLAKVPGVGQVSPPVLSPGKTVAYFQVTLAAAPESGAAISTVRGPLRTTAHAAAPAGTTALVGGTTAVYVDIQAAVNHDYLVVFPIAAVLIMLILGLLLRSVVAPWYLIASVGLGFAATLGSTVLIFQHLDGQPGLIFLLPIIMYLFVVALGTDYNILMIARLREEARAGRTPREAAAMAVRHAGPTVAAAGLILTGTFASLMLAGNSILVQMGFAISFGIAVASFVMALFFTPALTALIGHAAWWPGHADTARDPEVAYGDPNEALSRSQPFR